MNIRTASLLTALLFLAAPLAVMPSATAAVAENYECPAQGTPEFESDPLFGAACAIITTPGVGDWLREGWATGPNEGPIRDQDNDGRPDGWMLQVPAADPTCAVACLFYDGDHFDLAAVQLDFFHGDPPAPGADLDFQPMLLAPTSGTNQQPYRFSTTFERQLGFRDGTQHTPESFDFAVYKPVDAASPHEEGDYQDGRCVLCVNVGSMRIVFGQGNADAANPHNEGIVDIDTPAEDGASIESKNGAILHIRHTGSAELRQVLFSDGYGFIVKEAFIGPNGDLDDDGFSDQEELASSCFSNPTNPLSTCDDLDGDGFENDVDEDPFVPVKDTDGDGVFDAADNCISIANEDQANVDGDALGDACDDTDGDTFYDATELATQVGPVADRMDYTKADTDGDGLTDCQEVTRASDVGTCATRVPAAMATKPNVVDTDGDTLSDCAERRLGSCTYPAIPAGYDGDFKTDPTKLDSDSPADGFNDNVDNCRQHGNADQADLDLDLVGDACDLDIDGDGLTNARESGELFTDPSKADTDGDGLTDKQEVDDNTRCPSDFGAPTDGLENPVSGAPVAEPCQSFIVPGRRGSTGEIPVLLVPYTVPDFPPVYAFLDPNKKDTCGDGTDDSAADLGKTPCTPSVPPVPAFGLPAGDSYDYYDTTGDGATGDGLRNDDQSGANGASRANNPRQDASDVGPNGQLDAVESSLMYYDQDPSSSPAQDSHGRFGGASGVTIIVWESPSLTPYAKNRPANYLRYGDVTATAGLAEVLVVEFTDSNTIYFRTLCVVREQGVPALYLAEGAFDPASTTPCGDRVNGWDAAGGLPGINDALGLADPFNLFGLYDNDANGESDYPYTQMLTFNDADRDGIPESATVILPDGPCDSNFAVGIPCKPGAPTNVDLTSVQGVADVVYGALGGAGADPCTLVGPPAPGCEDACDSTAPDAAICVPEECGPTTPDGCVAVEPCTLAPSLPDCAAPVALSANAGPDYSGAEATAISITGSGAGGTAPYTCAWTSTGTAVIADPAACATTVTYEAAGSYELTLTVTDAESDTATDTAAVTVTAEGETPALAAEAGGPYSGEPSVAVAITGTANRESGYTCLWSGEGATFADDEVCSTTVTFDSVGAKTITLTVTEGTTTDTDDATVNVAEPVEPACEPGLEGAWPDCAVPPVPDDVPTCEPGGAAKVCILPSGPVGRLLGLPIPGVRIQVSGAFTLEF